MFKVLITSGATRERIDGVRFISNFSSGKTGANLAGAFTKKGIEVYYLHGTVAAVPVEELKKYEFSDFNSLNMLLMKLLKENSFDAIIHAAAVSDYSIKEIIADDKSYLPATTNKLNSNLEEVCIKLKRNYKIINFLRTYAKPNPSNINPCIIAFKLTNTTSTAEKNDAIERLFLDSDVDYVVHNDINEINLDDERTFYIYDKNKKIASCYSRNDLSTYLVKLISGKEECL